MAIFMKYELSSSPEEVIVPFVAVPMESCQTNFC